MKRSLIVLSLLLAVSAQAAPPLVTKPPAPVAPAAQPPAPKFDFQGVNVAQVIALLYGEVLKQPYVLDPNVLGDQRLVSFRFDASKGELRTFLRAFLDSLGFAIEMRGGVDFVTVKPAEQKGPALELFVYRPKYRDLAYLTELLRPLFKNGSFTVNRTVRAAPGNASSTPAPSGTAAALIDQKSDVMVFQGTAAEIDMLKRVLPQVDTAMGEVLVKGVVYEVSTGQNEASGFQLALSLLGGKLGVTIGTPPKGDNAITLKTGAIDAAIGALAGDSRFKVVSTPYLRVKSGRSASLTVGQDVPVLGSVSYPQGGGTPVRSIEYKSSGVIFNIAPQVRDRTIDLEVSQQVSNFVKTETGVDDSPTLIKRELRTHVSALDGELIVLGGLRDEKDNASRTGLSFLPDFLRARSSSSNQTEILLMLQLTKTAS
ncbi:type II secretion system protein GspD [Pseudogulbenkiania ferrooxidans]|uniref:Type II and III secretion system protein n=1 Tax=Pseudogulbenkiania ferrooxidans 2002 TaxID=279714 RepID=B9Z8I1_9NEIS|nr:type II secretory pathway protein [Pseudogulbenkiania ferrooxidans]EEG06919.1 type II and III secretion system protein [Pseudogulbenkiania ferrooxidans 2002]